MKTAQSQLNKSAIAIEDAQTEIRLLIKQSWMSNERLPQIAIRLDRIISKALKSITIARLKEDTRRSLKAFAQRQWQLWKGLKITPRLLVFLGAYATNTPPPKQIPSAVDLKAISRLQGVESYEYITYNKGVPLNKYYKEVWNEGVKPTLDRLMNEIALDPNDFTGRNSLRNLAEMEVRYNDHLNKIANLKESGEKLVIASSHADCSKRCAPHQGKVYSLDGTYGRTADGRKYEPLENATDIYYTTKAGRVYKNGLLGFNCRHDLYPFKGQQPTVISEEQRKHEYSITQTQRQLERAVRKKRVEALMLKDIDKLGYKQAKAKASELYTNYRNYCNDNDRAYYPMRVAI